MDRYFAKNPNTPAAQVQLVGITALFIASKVEEICPPTAEELAQYTGGYCAGASLTDLEEVGSSLRASHSPYNLLFAIQSMLLVLQWKCSPFTALNWLKVGGGWRLPSKFVP